MRRSLLVGIAVALAGCAGGGATRSIRHVGTADVYHARVIEARGPLVPQRGDACTIEVHHTQDGFYNCRIRVECGGDVVYGLADGGYNACYVEDSHFVFARDRNGTRIDGDPRLYFDVVGGRVYVSDDGPDVELELDLAGTPAQYDGARQPPGPTGGPEA